MLKQIKRIIGKINSTNYRIIQVENAQYEILRLVRENYWANVFNNAIKGSTWFNNVPLNIGRWAAGYPLLYVIFRILNEIKPENILELGMGESTRMIQSYKQQHNVNALCITVEHDKNWVDIKKQNGLSFESISVITPQLEKLNVSGKETLQYKDLPNLLVNYSEHFDLILIDGPFGSQNFSRFNIIDIVERNLISENFIIIMDDYNREGEKETITKLRELLIEKNITFKEGVYSGDKDSIIITSQKYQFLTTL